MIWEWAKLKLLSDFAPQSVFMRYNGRVQAKVNVDFMCFHVCAANAAYEPHKC